eukprot:8563990-Ditylum_brightwellii.AAC.1
MALLKHLPLPSLRSKECMWGRIHKLDTLLDQQEAQTSMEAKPGKSTPPRQRSVMKMRAPQAYLKMPYINFLQVVPFH